MIFFVYFYSALSMDDVTVMALAVNINGKLWIGEMVMAVVTQAKSACQ